MNLLTAKHLESLKIREYTSDTVVRKGFDLKTLSANHNITHLPYVELLETLEENYLEGLRRHLVQNWNLIAQKLEDINVSNTTDMVDLCAFFVEDVHRVYFFIENLFFYFFPN